jgi:N-acetylmuramoyl-L-alanine amidase
MIEKIVFHCAATPDEKDFTAAQFHLWHQSRGWDGIGYHYVIRRCGKLDHGRPEYWTGSHVRGHNTGSIGVCFVGTEDMTDKQFDTAEVLLKGLQSRYPEAELYGHCELDDGKECPGTEVMDWISRIRTSQIGASE